MEVYKIALLLMCVGQLLKAQTTSDICAEQVTCGDCIAASPDCSWCKSESFIGNQRCAVRGSHTQCLAEDLEDPNSEITHENEGSMNQVVPTQINATVRPGLPITFNVTVRSQRNYPLDIYLLLDVSSSLSDDIMNLRTLSSLLTTTLANISRNYLIGLGTFVDKPVIPYSPQVPAMNQFGFCSTGLSECVEPHSYHHLLSLTDDTEAYEVAVNSRTNISYGADPLEGGLDAMMQAAVCDELIGWRENARHLLVFISDAPSHIAGDGKLAGIISPNDGKCHMSRKDNGDYEYTHWNQLDYPSTFHLQNVLRERDIIPIFGTTVNSRLTYQNIQRQIPDAEVGSFSVSEGTNIIDLIQESYENVSQRITFQPINSNGLQFSYSPISGCNNVQSDGSCFGVEIDDEVTFQVNITLENCADKQDRLLVIRVPGFGSMEINLEPLCECQCAANQVQNSSLCRDGMGSLVCGVCSCSALQEKFKCPVVNGMVCSGNGQCDDCGQCQCNAIEGNKRLFGEACECDNFSCPVDTTNNMTCGGRGTCCQGSCQCMTSNLTGLPFTGSLCTCSPDNHTCIDPQAPERGICYGRGECQCGECVCSNDYNMEFCSNCLSDSCGLCQLYSHCVLCEKGLNTTNCRNCSTITIDLFEDAMYDGAVARLNAPTMCTTQVDNCEHEFQVEEDERTGHIVVVARSNTVCYQDPLPFIIAGAATVAMIVFTVLLLIIIKSILKCYDYIEYKKFRFATDNLDFGPSQNPLYVCPEKEYTNVLYKPGRKRNRNTTQRTQLPYSAIN